MRTALRRLRLEEASATEPPPAPASPKSGRRPLRLGLFELLLIRGAVGKRRRQGPMGFDAKSTFRSWAVDVCLSGFGSSLQPEMRTGRGSAGAASGSGSTGSGGGGTATVSA